MPLKRTKQTLSPEEKLMVEALKCFFLTEKTTNVNAELDYDKKSEDDTITNENGSIVFNGINIRYLARIGNVFDNRPFCRVFLMENPDKEEGNFDTLGVSFRPLNLEGYDKLSFEMVKAWSSSIDKSVADNIDGKLSASKLVATMSTTHNRETVPLNYEGIQVRKGDYDLLKKWKYETKNYLTGEMKNIRDVPIYIAQLIAKYKVENVLFTGFSLGAGMATACSILTSILLKTNDFKKNINIDLFSCCGIPTCNNEASEYIERNFRNKLNIVVKNDYVSCVPTKTNLVNFAPTLEVDYDSKNENIIFRKEAWNEIKDVRDTDSDQFAYFTGGKGAFDVVANALRGMASATNFKNYHLSAEDFVPILIFTRLHGRANDMITITDPEKVCEWYSENSYAMKYKKCYTSLCNFKEFKLYNGNKKANVCLYKGDKKDENEYNEPEKLSDYKNRQYPSPELSHVSKYTGKLAMAEQAYINTINDPDIRTDIVRDIIRTSGLDSKYKYLGTYLIAPQDFVKKVKKQQGDFYISEIEFMKAMAYHVGDSQTLLFICGSTFPSDSTQIFSIGNIAHYLAFSVSKNGGIIFNPGTRCWNSKLSEFAIKTVKESFPNIEFKEDQQILDKCPLGPQDISRGGIFGPIRSFCSYSDNFCQTWTIFWITNHILGNCPASSWPKDPEVLDSAIRTFVVWLLGKFKELRDSTNEEYQKESHTKNDVLNIMKAGYQSFRYFREPKKGDSCFNLTMENLSI